jgi:hypothetical protein
MNNITAYIIYLIVAIFITIVVGRDLHKNGYSLILDLFENKSFARTINNLLLTGYYLVNVGYITIAISSFETINSTQLMITELAYKIGTILLILGILHFNNILILHILSKRKQQIIHLFNN